MKLVTEVYDEYDVADVFMAYGVDKYSLDGYEKIIELCSQNTEPVDIQNILDRFIEFGEDESAWGFEEFANAEFKDRDGNNIPISPFDEFVSGDPEWGSMTKKERFNVYIDDTLDWLHDEGYHVYDLENGDILIEAPQD